MKKHPDRRWSLAGVVRAHADEAATRERPGRSRADRARPRASCPVGSISPLRSSHRARASPIPAGISVRLAACIALFALFALGCDACGPRRGQPVQEAEHAEDSGVSGASGTAGMRTATSCIRMRPESSPAPHRPASQARPMMSWCRSSRATAHCCGARPSIPMTMRTHSGSPFRRTDRCGILGPISLGGLYQTR